MLLVDEHFRGYPPGRRVVKFFTKHGISVGGNKA